MRGARSMLLLAVAVALPAAASADSFDPWQETARYELVYRVDLASIPVEAGQPAALWIPLAGDGPDQQVQGVDVEAPIAWEERTDGWGNRMAFLRWTGRAPEGAVVATARVVRRPSTGMPRSEVASGSRDDPQRFLSRTKRIPLDGLIEQIAVQESKGLDSDAEKIRAYYDYVLANMRYSKEGEGWGEGDAIWACTEKYGNCTDFHSLFLGMARSQGIPARFWIGFPVPPGETAGEIGGYHCWAEAWDPAQGWVPFDASEAWKAKRHDDYFGRLPSDRVAFTIGRDLVLSPPQQAEPLNFFIYPYAEVDGVPVEKVEASFHFRRIDAETAAVGAAGSAPR